ncbi:enhancer of rudimentary, putative [Eimeria tenella]|nr:enhancer of rudimentary, putative [Eimeria tenella]CDJ38278.1 enhancer of rudimentary, putative [Eimeria tenella]|eukprot:XP_013229116.1 enhancer of rudimentary, putative [Eimeria tenella]
MDGVCQLYEQALKGAEPRLRQITYDVNDLFSYLDSLNDLCALVHDSELNAYAPHNKAWIKDQVFKHLKRQARA